MPYDDIIIGSGLSALGVALGLRGKGRRILVVAGAESGFRHYPAANVPAARGGRGGMGSHWHGVIPLGLRHRPEGFEADHWTRLAQHFYPGAGLGTRIGDEQYFVPRRPIRPAEHFARLLSEGAVEIVDDDAVRLDVAEGDAPHRVQTGDRDVAGRQLWLCAGALGTPGLLARSGLIAGGARTVSDHVIGYAGRLAASDESRAMMATVRRDSEGVFFPFRFGGDGDHFFTLRPARFDFAPLDAGIAKRAIFGLPANRVVSGLAGHMSPGLIAEALYNKLGLFPQARRYSVYFQTVVSDAYSLDEGGRLLPNPGQAVGSAIERARADLPFAGVEPSRQPELYIPGIHLHGSLTREECERFGPGRRFNSLHVADASALRDIGPEHHSFAMMATAFGRAVAAANQD